MMFKDFLNSEDPKAKLNKSLPPLTKCLSFIFIILFVKLFFESSIFEIFLNDFVKS